MFRLNFTTRVLGRDAARRFRRKEVTQTVRSPILDTVPAYHRGLMEIALDGQLLGLAKQISTETVKFKDLTIEDARRGGFDSISDLASALKRAGFRFKPTEEYTFFRVIFLWQ